MASIELNVSPSEPIWLPLALSIDVVTGCASIVRSPLRRPSRPLPSATRQLLSIDFIFTSRSARTEWSPSAARIVSRTVL